MRAWSWETVKMTTSFWAVVTSLRIERHAQCGVEHDAQERAAAAQAAAVGHPGIVGEHSVDPDHGGVGGPAQRLYSSAGQFAGDPVGCVGCLMRRAAVRCARRGSWRPS